MSLKGVIGCCLCVCFTMMVCVNSHGAPPKKLKVPALTISLERLDLEAQEIMIRVVVTNNGKTPLLLPHLQEGLLEQYGSWMGWTTFVRDSQRERKCFCHPMERYLPPKDGRIELKPKEHFSVTINLAHTRPLYYPEIRDGKEFYPELMDVEGEYKVQVLFISETYLPWPYEVESNTITFVVEHEKQDRSSQEDTQDTTPIFAKRINVIILPYSCCPNNLHRFVIQPRHLKWGL